MEKIISILSILIVLPILTLSSCDTSTAPPPTNEENLTEQTMDVVYDNVMTYQLSYIRSLQLSSGAIKIQMLRTVRLLLILLILQFWLC